MKKIFIVSIIILITFTSCAMSEESKNFFLVQPQIQDTSIQNLKDEHIDIYEDTNYDTPQNFDEKHRDRLYGTAEEINYISSVSNKQKDAWVILPYGYNKNKEYPVLYLLHGMSGDSMSWYNMNAMYIVQNTHYDYGTEDMIVVIPYVFTCADYEEDELEYPDILNGYDNFPQELLNDLMPYINENYSVSKDKNSTAIAGYSLGGREASYIGFSLPDMFGYIGGFSASNGVFDPDSWSDKSILLPNYDFNSIKNSYKLLFYQVGYDDPYIKATQRYDKRLNKKDIQHIYYEMDGGHEGSVWKNGLYNFARRLFW